MPSYRDGRLCCDSAEQCAKLNKNYPLCSELVALSDYSAGTECSAEIPEIPCIGEPTQTCGCNNGGTQTRTCDTTTGTWSSWSTCSSSATCSCDAAKEPKKSETCNRCGTRSRKVECDQTNGEWKTEDWGDCSVRSSSQCGSSGGGGSSNSGSAQSATFYVFSTGYGAYYSGDSAMCGCGCDRGPVMGTQVTQICSDQNAADDICSRGGVGCVTNIPSVNSETISSSSYKCEGWTIVEVTGTGTTASGYGDPCPSGHICADLGGGGSITCSGVSAGSCVTSGCSSVSCCSSTSCSGAGTYKCTSSSGSSCTAVGYASVSGYICSSYAKSNSNVCAGSAYGNSCSGGYGGYGGYGSYGY